MRLNEKIVSTYKREIENKPVKNITFYSALSVLIIIFTFFLGIRPTVRAINQNLSYKNQLSVIKESMETKKEQIETGENIMREHANKILLLNKAIPDKIDLDQFLAELVIVSAKSGFVLDRVRRETEGDFENEVDLEFTGNIERLPNLLKEMEEMDRFVTVDNIRSKEEDGETKIRMRVLIYTL